MTKFRQKVLRSQQSLVPPLALTFAASAQLGCMSALSSIQRHSGLYDAMYRCTLLAGMPGRDPGIPGSGIRIPTGILWVGCWVMTKRARAMAAGDYEAGFVIT